MSRRLVLGCAFILAISSSVRAEEPPEKLLAPTSQAFLRWDGVTPHAKAYQGSALGAVMAGPTGDAIRSLIAKGPKLIGANLLAEPLLEGKSPAELKAVHADFKNAEKLLDLILDKGVMVSAEVIEPRPTFNGIGKAFGSLLRGDVPDRESFSPDVQVYVVVPDVGERAEVLFGSIRLLTRDSSPKAIPLAAALDRKGFAVEDSNKSGSTCAAWWLEGKHFVFYAGSSPIDAAVRKVRDNAAKGGLTDHPLYQRCRKPVPFESVARGFVDTAAMVQMAKRLAGPFMPGLSEKLDAIGIGNLKAIAFCSGFDGKESRAVYEFDLPDPRTGLARILKAKPVTPAELPPLPPDVSRFSMLRVDPAGMYDAFLAALETLSADESGGVEDRGKTPQEAKRLRRDYFDREFNKLLGLNFKDDLLPHLGDKFIMYQSPVEGFSLLGNVYCLSVKDGSKVQAALERMQRGLETFASSPVKVRRKTLRGVEIRELYSRGFYIFTPTYAVVGGWLVFALHPQAVQGFVLRHAGDLERWKPDAATGARLAKMPADSIGIQFCNPKSTVHNLCSVGPILMNALSMITADEGNSKEFDPLDIGLVPNGYELGRHLFPNLTYTRDDGSTIRIEVNESFSLPFEFIGFDLLPLVFGASAFAGLGF